MEVEVVLRLCWGCDNLGCRSLEKGRALVEGLKEHGIQETLYNTSTWMLFFPSLY